MCVIRMRPSNLICSLSYSTSFNKTVKGAGSSVGGMIESDHHLRFRASSAKAGLTVRWISSYTKRSGMSSCYRRRESAD